MNTFFKNFLHMHMSKKKNVIFWCLIILTIIRLVMLIKEPVIFMVSPHDDDLMINMAMNIDIGDWLGQYSQYTLLKGMGFPLFLVIIHKLGIPYVMAIAGLYILASMVFVYSLRPIIKSDVLLIFCYILLLFNPGINSMGGIQRVYLSTVVSPEVLLIFSSIFSMYIFRENIKKLLKWSLIASITLAFMWQTKDDGIWIMPFVIVATIITITLLIKKNGRTSKSYISVLICIMPFVGLFWFNTIISSINYVKYGTYVTREIDEGNYAELIGTLYSVESDDDIDYVSVSSNKLKRIYSISPTLRSIHSEIDEQIKIWDRYDRHPGDGEVEDGWFMFMLRDAMAEKGYFEDAKKMNEFCKNVIVEINNAEQNNLIGINKTFFSNARLSPWKKEYLNKLVEEIRNSLFFTISFSDCYPEFYSHTTSNPRQSYERFIYSTANFEDNIYFHMDENDLFFYTGELYSILSPFLFALAMVIYILELIKYTLDRIKHREKDHSILLFQSAIILSLIVLLLGMSYTHITAFSIYSSTYFVAPYVLCLMFEAISISAYFNGVLRK